MMIAAFIIHFSNFFLCVLIHELGHIFSHILIVGEVPTVRFYWVGIAVKNTRPLHISRAFIICFLGPFSGFLWLWISAHFSLEWALSSLLLAPIHFQLSILDYKTMFRYLRQYIEYKNSVLGQP